MNGDLILMAEAGQIDLLVHGANCFNTMGSGIAGQLAHKYPQVVKADNETKSGDKNKLGMFTIAAIPTTHGFFHVINAYTQYTFSRGQDVFEYEKFSEFLSLFSNYVEKLAEILCPEPEWKINVGFPYIGCGLAGGDESRIVPMIEEFAENCKDFATVYLVRKP